MKTALSIFGWMALEQTRAQLKPIGAFTAYLLVAGFWSYQDSEGQWNGFREQPELLLPAVLGWVIIWQVGVHTLTKNLDWWKRLPISRLQLILQLTSLNLLSLTLAILSLLAWMLISKVADQALHAQSESHLGLGGLSTKTDAFEVMTTVIFLLYFSFISAAGRNEKTSSFWTKLTRTLKNRTALAQLLFNDPWRAIPYFLMGVLPITGVGSIWLHLMTFIMIGALIVAREWIPETFHFPKGLRTRWHLLSTSVLVLPLAGWVIWGAELTKRTDLSFEEQIDLTEWIGADVRASLGSPLTLDHLKQGLREANSVGAARSTLRHYLDVIEPIDDKKRAAAQAGVSLAWIQEQNFAPVVARAYLQHFASLERLSLTELEPFLNQNTDGIEGLEREEVAQIALRFADADEVQAWLSRARSRDALSVGLLAATTWGPRPDLADLVRTKLSSWENQHGYATAYLALQVLALTEGHHLKLSALPDLTRTPAALTGPTPQAEDPPLSSTPDPERIECGEVGKITWLSGSPATLNICARIYARTQKNAALLSSLSVKWLSPEEIQSRMKPFLPKDSVKL